MKFIIFKRRHTAPDGTKNEPGKKKRSFSRRFNPWMEALASKPLSPISDTDSASPMNTFGMTAITTTINSSHANGIDNSRRTSIDLGSILDEIVAVFPNAKIDIVDQKPRRIPIAHAVYRLTTNRQRDYYFYGFVRSLKLRFSTRYTRYSRYRTNTATRPAKSKFRRFRSFGEKGASVGTDSTRSNIPRPSSGDTAPDPARNMDENPTFSERFPPAPPLPEFNELDLLD